MKHITEFIVFLGLLGAVVFCNNYASYKKLQCIDHNTKGFSLRFVSTDKQERAQQLMDAKLNALTKSDYSFFFGCRFYENDKLIKFVYDYPMTDEEYWNDWNSIVKRINEQN
jgi:hypothetical protein